MGSIKAPMLVDELGKGMRILKEPEYHADDKSASLKRPTVATTAPRNNSASYKIQILKYVKFQFFCYKSINGKCITPSRKKLIPPFWLGKSFTVIGDWSNNGNIGISKIILIILKSNSTVYQNIWFQGKCFKNLILQHL